MTRLAAVGLLVLLAVPTSQAVAAFGLDEVTEKARQLAKAPFREPKGQVPDWLLKINYDQWRDIRFRPEGTLWRKGRSPFQVQFFHPGLFYDRPIMVNVIDGQTIRPVEFSPSQFDYGKNEFGSRVPQTLGYAGFRIHYPIKTRDYYDEVIVFLGASYYRGVGRNHVFGLSARGLAINTADSRGEEFPYFKEFWLVSPAANATEFVMYALLDSESVSGAYRFAVVPGDQTSVKVECRLFPRSEVRKLGLAALNSMFFLGENSLRRVDDFRPEVHDSDGLQLHLANGEWLWRPLDNPTALRVSGYRADSLRGFGLLQRDRNFDHYQDLETRPDLRPSVWIVPGEGFGPGRIELVEIPTDSDVNDNIVAYWVPDSPPKPGQMGVFSYTQYWYSEDPTRSPGSQVVGTRRDRGTAKDAHRLVLDLAGKKLSTIPEDRVLRGVVTVVGGDEAGELLEQQVVKNSITGGWRLTFQVRPKREPVELRAFLDQGGETLTETWSYVIQP